MTTTDPYLRTRKNPHSPADDSAQGPTSPEDSGTTTRPTVPIVRGLALLDKDPRYDRRTGHTVLPFDVYFLDGTKATATLELDPGRVLLLSIQLERAIALREAAREKAPE